MGYVLSAVARVLEQPTAWGAACEMALLAGPLWAAALIGLLLGWALRRGDPGPQHMPHQRGARGRAVPRAHPDPEQRVGGAEGHRHVRGRGGHARGLRQRRPHQRPRRRHLRLLGAEESHLPRPFQEFLGEAEARRPAFSWTEKRGWRLAWS